MVKTIDGKNYIVQAYYIRAIASLIVALYHLGGKVLPVLNYGWLGVEMFFFLSGFIICWAIPENYSIKKDGLKFLQKRFIRIEPPYIISIFILLFINITTIDNYNINFRNILLHFAYLNNFFSYPYLNAVYWTLGVEFQYYLFIVFTFPLFLKSYGKWILLFLSIIPILLKIEYTILFGVFPIFALGILCFLFKKNKINPINFILFNLAILTCIIFGLGLAEAAISLVTLLIIICPLKPYKIVLFFSKISFSLYLIHDIIGSRIVIRLGELYPKTNFYKGSIFIIGICLSIITAYIFYNLVEKPFLKRSKKILYT